MRFTKYILHVFPWSQVHKTGKCIIGLHDLCQALPVENWGGCNCTQLVILFLEKTKVCVQNTTSDQIVISAFVCISEPTPNLTLANPPQFSTGMITFPETHNATG